MQFSGKVVVVTGAASGIGAATAALFAREGALVVASDVSSLDPLVAEVTTAGGRIIGVRCDVSDATSVKGLFDRVIAEFGAVNVVIANAGIGILGNCDSQTEADWDRTFAVNVKGAFLCAKLALPHLRAAGGGAILFTASIGGVEGVRGLLAYAASKAAVINLGRSLALDHAHENIRVNIVCPGATDTPMLRSGPVPVEAIAQTLPLRRLSQPEDIAEAFLFLASEKARCITGQTITVDSGATAGDYSIKFIGAPSQ